MSDTLSSIKAEAEKKIETAGDQESLEEIRLDYETMVQLDFIFARAGLALDMNASEPVFNDEHRIRLRQARHPLLDRKKAVPVDIRLGDDFDLGGE